MRPLLLLGAGLMCAYACGGDELSPRGILARNELRAIAERVRAFNRDHEHVADIARTPEAVPCGPVAWNDPSGTLQRIGYAPDHVVPFSFELVNGNTLRAYADRDCDRDYAIYELHLDPPALTTTNDPE